MKKRKKIYIFNRDVMNLNESGEVAALPCAAGDAKLREFVPSVLIHLTPLVLPPASRPALIPSLSTSQPTPHNLPPSAASDYIISY